MHNEDGRTVKQFYHNLKLFHSVEQCINKHHPDIKNFVHIWIECTMYLHVLLGFIIWGIKNTTNVDNLIFYTVTHELSAELLFMLSTLDIGFSLFKEKIVANKQIMYFPRGQNQKISWNYLRELELSPNNIFWILINSSTVSILFS